MSKVFVITNVFGEKKEVFLKFGKYPNERMAIDLIEKKTKEPYARVTINEPSIVLLDQVQMIVKNYSENEGMVDFLLANRLVKKEYSNFYVGFGGECCICEMTEELKGLVKEAMSD